MGSSGIVCPTVLHFPGFSNHCDASQIYGLSFWHGNSISRRERNLIGPILDQKYYFPLDHDDEKNLDDKAVKASRAVLCTPLQDPFMRRMEGSLIIRHHREPKLLMSEVPRNRMGRLQTGSVKTTFKEHSPMHPPPGGGGFGIPVDAQPMAAPPALPTPKVQSEAKRIDVISRIIFPASFLGFNVIYWSYYLTRKSLNHG